MSTNILSHFQKLSESMPTKIVRIEYLTNKGNKAKGDFDYNPLTGSVNLGRVTVPYSELKSQLKMWYSATLISATIL